MWIGKLFGFLIGFFLSGFNLLGGLAGLAFGHMIDSRGRAGVKAHRDPRSQEVFFQTLFRLLGHVAKADGRISEAEIAQTESLMNQSGLNASQRSNAISQFKAGAAPGFDVRGQLAEFQAVCGRSPLMRQTLISYLISLGLADGTLDNDEKQVISTIARALGMNQQTLEHLIRMIEAQAHFSSHKQSGRRQQRVTKNELDLAYEALGVDASISDKDLKQAYRRLMSENHPDKLMGRGLPTDMIEMATERVQDIQAAYNKLREHRKKS